MLKMIKPRLKEQYKIKIGVKGNSNAKGNRLPKKLDHFIVNKNEKDSKGDFLVATEIMKKLGDRPVKIPIALLYNNLEDNFYSSLAYYNKTRLMCSGDGEKAKHFDIKADDYIENDCSNKECKYFKNKQCKPSGILKCIFLFDGQIGGAAVFRTHAWNTITYLTSSIQTLLNRSGGKIAGVPLWLTMSPETRVVKGQQRIIFTVSIESQGNIGQLKAIEADLPELPEFIEEPKDIADEFYWGEE